MPGLNYAIVPAGGGWVSVGVDSLAYTKGDKLETRGLSNCLGFIFHDRARSVGVMAHCSPEIALPRTIAFMEHELIRLLGATAATTEVMIAGGVGRSAATFTAIDGLLAAAGINHTVYDSTMAPAAIARPAGWVRGDGGRGFAYDPGTGAVELLNLGIPTNIGDIGDGFTLVLSAIP